jgi:hypothetical protein
MKRDIIAVWPEQFLGARMRADQRLRLLDLRMANAASGRSPKATLWLSVWLPILWPACSIFGQQGRRGRITKLPADHEEGGLQAVAGQDVEHALGDARGRAVVEGQCQPLRRNQPQLVIDSIREVVDAVRDPASWP